MCVCVCVCVCIYIFTHTYRLWPLQESAVVAHHFSPAVSRQVAEAVRNVDHRRARQRHVAQHDARVRVVRHAEEGGEPAGHVAGHVVFLPETARQFGHLAACLVLVQPLNR